MAPVPSRYDVYLIPDFVVMTSFTSFVADSAANVEAAKKQMMADMTTIRINNPSFE